MTKPSDIIAYVEAQTGHSLNRDEGFLDLEESLERKILMLLSRKQATLGVWQSSL